MNGTSSVLVNGLPGTMISVRDRGLHFGDGLFETLRCENGRLRWFDRHMARLKLGGERLGIELPDAALLRTEAEAVISGQSRALVKIIVTRGEATARGYAPRGDERPSRIVSAHDWPETGSSEFRVGLSPIRLGSHPLLAGLKHLNRLEQVMAQRDATARQLSEVLMGPNAEDVVCGSMTNLFLIERSVIVTPPITHCGVAGVLRSLVLELAPQLGFTVRIASVTIAMVEAATALFVTNVRLGVQAVHGYEGRRLAIDERCAALQELLDGTPQ